MSEKPLTDEQVENWRKALAAMFGSYALMMSVEEIQKWHDKIQAGANKFDNNWKEIK